AGRSAGSQGEWLRLRIGDAAATIVAAAAPIPLDAPENSCDGVQHDRTPHEVAYVAAIRVAAALDRRASGRPTSLPEPDDSSFFAPGGLAERVLTRLGLAAMWQALAASPAPALRSAGPRVDA